MIRKATMSLAVMLLGASTLPADFTYQQTSTVTGGALASMMKFAGVFSKQAREPIRSTIAVKGNRMVHRNATTVSIIDLDAQTITNIDMQKKTYTVMTFEQMKQMMEQMSRKMKEGDGKAEMSFKVSADATGKTRQVAGFDAKEMVLKMVMEGADKEKGQKGSMVITTDMWISSGVPGYAEAQAFQKRMAEKLDWTPGGNMFMSRPDVAKGMAEVYKEVAKLDGIPVLQVITMGAEGLPAAEAAPAQGEGQAQAQAQPQAQSKPQPQVDRPSLGGALSGALGGRFGLGRKKQQPKPEEPASSAKAESGSAPESGSAAGAGSPAASGSLIEMKMELSDFSSSPVDDSLFAVPSGFKKVDPKLD